MLREVDFVDSDWDALTWALGSTAAICRHSLLQRLTNWRRSAGRDTWLPRRSARWISSVAPGMAVAVIIWAICVAVLSALEHTSWFAPSDVKVVERLFIIAIPEAVYLLGAVALWRRHRRAASGILAAGAILITHGIMHFVTYG
jgi:hypothetical protein